MALNSGEKWFADHKELVKLEKFDIYNDLYNNASFKIQFIFIPPPQKKK